jgi:DNA-3-methyladenine glycosylase I
MELIRCPWCQGDELYTRYHDKEWGKPQRSSRKLFEALILDGAQAGLSWITVLRRREGYRAAFDGMDPEKIARYTEKDFARLLADPRIIRNRLKIRSAIGNARAYLAMAEKGEVPASTPLAVRISRELKARGFTFTGPTIIYAFMQAMGLVDDHLVTCFRHSRRE